MTTLRKDNKRAWLKLGETAMSEQTKQEFARAREKAEMLQHKRPFRNIGTRMLEILKARR